LFGICEVGTSGAVYAVGHSDYEFTIMSVSKPFIFALVCEYLGPDELREKIGVNATGRAHSCGQHPGQVAQPPRNARSLLIDAERKDCG
jgi:glutaminase